MRILARAALCSAFLSLVWCSPASVGSAADAGPSAQQACADNAYARCSHLLTCSRFMLTYRYGDMTTCENAARTSCLQIMLAPSAGATPAHNETCTQKIPDWDCVDFINDVNPPPECAHATGALPSGAPCEVAGQCQTGFCSIEPGRVCGVCAQAPVANSPCQQLTTCGEGLTCESSSGRCAGYGGVGAQCGTGLPCAAGLGCVGASSTTGVLGTCQQAVTTQGAPCGTKGAGCAFSSGLACNSTSMTCAPIVVAGPGQTCGTIGGQSQVCGEEGNCVRANGASAGTCQGAVATGAACDLVQGPPCFPPSRCITTADGGTSGTCQVPDPSLCH